MLDMKLLHTATLILCALLVLDNAQAAVIQRCTGEELLALGLGAPSRPLVPRNLDKLSPRDRLYAIQAGSKGQLAVAMMCNLALFSIRQQIATGGIVRA
jgi:hypothetical protein